MFEWGQRGDLLTFFGGRPRRRLRGTVTQTRLTADFSVERRASRQSLLVSQLSGLSADSDRGCLAITVALAKVSDRALRVAMLPPLPCTSSTAPAP